MKSDRHGLFKLARSGVLNRVAAGVFLGLAANAAYAQSNAEGYVFGRSAAGSSIVVTSTQTGLKREVKTSADGTFRVSSLPVGTYKVTSTKDGKETVEEVVVRLGEGSAVRFDLAGSVALEAVRVTARAVPLVDVSKTDSGLNLGEAKIDSIPVARDISSVALLAPGTVAGDDGFGGIATFGGSTVSENQYFLNGFNISDLRTRLGPSTVPFEFFDQFQIKTGGYSAEFGRSTGGVVNATSKRGTNTWEAGMNFYWEPNGPRGSKPSVDNPDGSNLYYYGLDERETKQINFQAGGPIIKDTLFIYGLVNLRDTQSQDVTKNGYTLGFQRGPFANKRDSDDPFYAVKMDWQIAPNHALEFTGFQDRSTQRVTRFIFDNTNRTFGTPRGDINVESGGQTQIYRYTGQFFNDLTASLLYGRSTNNTTQTPQASDCPRVTDRRNAAGTGNLAVGAEEGCFLANVFNDLDVRKSYRVDLQYNLPFDVFGKHQFRIGADREDNLSNTETIQSGVFRYIISANPANGLVDGAARAPTAGQYVSVRQFRSAGEIKEKLDAYYLEDNWQITPTVVASIGLRKETFEDLNTAGQKFLDLEGDLAPRLGIAWDVFGDSRSKLYANYGRYFIPVGTQSAVRNGTAEFSRRDVYSTNGTQSNDRFQIPNQGAFIGSIQTANGRVNDPRTLVSPTVEPSSQDEYIVGYESALPDNLFGKGASAGIRMTYRTLNATLEDIAIDQGLNAALNGRADANLQDCDSDGTPDNFACGFDFYFITNPGAAATVFLPTDAATGNYDATGDGDLRLLTVPADVLNYDKPKRKYYAVELTSEKRFGRKGFIQGSYTWSQSFGNYEGFVNSSIEQDDVAITQDFDQPGFLEGANGFLANDRRHNVKLYGSYDVLPELRLGASLSASSGRPLSAYGYFRDLDAPEAVYEQFSFYTTHPRFGGNDGADGNPRVPVLVPRGTAGRTSWIYNFDVTATYTPKVFDNKLKLGVDVFNVFDLDEATEENEISELESTEFAPNYGLPTNFQAPRSVRLRAEYQF